MNIPLWLKLKILKVVGYDHCQKCENITQSNHECKSRELILRNTRYHTRVETCDIIQSILVTEFSPKLRAGGLNPRQEDLLRLLCKFIVDLRDKKS